MIPITQKEFDLLSGYIKEHYGIYLKDEKKSLLTSRLNNVLVSLNFDSFSEYYDYIRTDRTGKAIATLLDKMTTNHTYFMREVDHFYFFRDKVLPYLAGSVKDRDLRVWCAASSTGEEAYTLAFLIDEFFGPQKAAWDTKILATDIAGSVLEAAKSGIYTNERLNPLPAAWKLRYFNRLDNERSVVVDRLRDEVIFRKFNLMEEIFPFRRKFHVIFCRNVMIYFDIPTKNRLIDKLYDCTEPGGYLFIGHSESLDREKTQYRYIMPAVYRKE